MRRFSPSWRKTTHKKVGLSLVDQIQTPVCHFLPPLGQKMTHNNDKVPCCRRQTRCARKS